MPLETLEKKFRELFGREPAVAVRSPGRINLLGEHTDYNDGFVFPAAIDKAIRLVAAPNKQRLFRFYAADFNDSLEVPATPIRKSKKAWANYLLGVAAQFAKTGQALQGIDCVFGGDIPIGAGLSSSAALETGFARVITEIHQLEIPLPEQVKMAQAAEHEFAGVLCGIMDQFAAVFGKAGHALRLDCRSLEFDYARLDIRDFEFILCDTGVKHSLAASAYNTRREECRQGVEILRKHHPGIRALRDADLQLLEKYRGEFDPVVFRRCRYVVEENRRVNRAFQNLQEGKLQAFGELMNQTHAGLRDDFEVSCFELDVLQDAALKTGVVVGSRMMGGGFGGCTLNLVQKDKSRFFTERIEKEYLEKTGKKPDFYRVHPADGTQRIY